MKLSQSEKIEESKKEENLKENSLETENKKFEQIAEGCGSEIFLDSEGNVYKAIKHKQQQINQCQHHNHHSKACKMLKNEYEIVSNLEHPNIITYSNMMKDFYILNKHYCVVEMQQMSYDFFDFYITPQDYTNNCIQQVKSNFYNLIQAMAFIHSQGIAHNDIKPENIFLMKKQDMDSEKLQNQLNFNQESEEEEGESNSLQEDEKIEQIGNEQREKHKKSGGSSSASLKYLESVCENTECICNKSSLGEIEELNPVLADFGHAYNKKEIHRGGASYQKKQWEQREISYMGPEVFASIEDQNGGQCFDEFKNDIFSMGQTIFMCVTKKYPRKLKIPTKQCSIYKTIIEKNMKAYWEEVKDFCPYFQEFDECLDFLDLTMKMMANNPEDRPSAEELLSHNFFSENK